jgi:hypothetical protein
VKHTLIFLVVALVDGIFGGEVFYHLNLHFREADSYNQGYHQALKGIDNYPNLECFPVSIEALRADNVPPNILSAFLRGMHDAYVAQHYYLSDRQSPFTLSDGKTVLLHFYCPY